MDILTLLADYHPRDDKQEEVKKEFLKFVLAYPDHLLRSCAPGHLTGSAFIVDDAGSRVLLVHHKKLNKWLQPGGHADGDADLRRVALREVQEETGLKNLEPLRDGIFDLDIHEIPARCGEPAHLHYDVRFLFRSGKGAFPRLSEESHSVEWVSLADVLGKFEEKSILRMAGKYTDQCRSVHGGPA